MFVSPPTQEGRGGDGLIRGKRGVKREDNV